MDYETLDNIADSYIPLLAIFTLLSLVLVPTRTVTAKSFVPVRILVLTVFLGTAYGMMFLDNALALWPMLAWDYSTHTAVSLVLVLFLVLLWPKQQGVMVLSWLAYCGLMLYQQYHTVADIVSTALCIIVLLAIFLSPMISFRSALPTERGAGLKAAFPFFQRY